MEFGTSMSTAPVFQNSLGLSAIPIDGHTFRIVNLSTPQSFSEVSFNQSQYDTSPQLETVYQIENVQPFYTLPSQCPTTPLSGTTELSSSFLTAAASSSSSSQQSPLYEYELSSVSPADECRPFTDSFLSTPSPELRHRSVTSLLESAPSTSPLGQHPYFSTLCEILETDTELQKMISNQPTKPNISSMGRDLLQRLNKLESRHPNEVTNLRSFYKQHASDIEMERFESIKSNERDGYYVELLNSHYDDQLRQVIQRINKSVRLLQESSSSLPTPPLSASTCVTNMNNLPETTPTTSGKYNQISPKPIDYQRLDVPAVTTTRPILSKQAIRRMETWYTEHLEHPYPTSSVVGELARVGGITVGQVKKWFANKRNRSKNTKSLTAIACRKRLEKLAQLLP